MQDCNFGYFKLYFLSKVIFLRANEKDENENETNLASTYNNVILLRKILHYKLLTESHKRKKLNEFSIQVDSITMHKSRASDK